MNVVRFLRIFVVFGSLLVIGACGSEERMTPVPYAVTFNVATDVNPDARGRPSPIVLKVFLLKSASAFDSADFFSLQDKPDALLGSQLIDVDRVILRPGDTKTVRYPGNAEGRALGVVAEYRSLQTNRWKLTVDLPRGSQSGLLRLLPGSPHETKVAIAVRNGGVERASGVEGHQ